MAGRLKILAINNESRSPGVHVVRGTCFINQRPLQLANARLARSAAADSPQESAALHRRLPTAAEVRLEAAPTEAS